MKTQKRLAADILKCSEKRIVFDNEQLEEIKQAITKHDIKQLIGAGVIKSKQKKGVSRARANKILVQKSKGQRKGSGKRKGTLNARGNLKSVWIKKIRKQRGFIKRLYDKEFIDTKIYRELYKKCKGNFFRSTRHIKIYLQERDILKEQK